MTSREDIMEILSKAKAAGHDLKMGDISFVILEQEYGDPLIAFRSIYGPRGTKEDAERHSESAGIDFVRKILTKKWRAKERKGLTRKFADISFEENKEALIELLDEIGQLKGTPDLPVKDAVKLETDIRTRLNDKFGTVEKVEERRVVVNVKYNHICEWTRKECFLQTKEYAMKQWDLVDREELEREYELVPKNRSEYGLQEQG